MDKWSRTWLSISACRSHNGCTHKNDQPKKMHHTDEYDEDEAKQKKRRTIAHNNETKCRQKRNRRWKTKTKPKIQRPDSLCAQKNHINMQWQPIAIYIYMPRQAIALWERRGNAIALQLVLHYCLAANVIHGEIERVRYIFHCMGQKCMEKSNWVYLIKFCFLVMGIFGKTIKNGNMLLLLLLRFAATFSYEDRVLYIYTAYIRSKHGERTG